MGDKKRKVDSELNTELDSEKTTLPTLITLFRELIQWMKEEESNFPRFFYGWVLADSYGFGFLIKL